MRAAMAAKNMSQSALARDINVSQGAIAQILSGDTKRTKALPEIATALGVSVRWLLGEADDPSPDAVALPTREILAQEFNLTPIRQVDIGYAMGGGTFIEDNPDTLWRHFDTDWIRTLTRSSPDLLFIANGIGDSMIPTLMDNDTLLFDRGQNAINQQDRIWAFAYGELGMVKRIRRQPNGNFLVISDNPAVADFEAADDEMFVIGRLIWIGRRA